MSDVLLAYSACSQQELGHFFQWTRGIHHRDISIGNMMYYETSNGAVKGVLNDFDLCSVHGRSSRIVERTGTMPFMALDLLTDNAWRGYVEHLYRHDAESILWVIVSIIGGYTAKGIQIRHAPFIRERRGGDYHQCMVTKACWLYRSEWRGCALPEGREPDRDWFHQMLIFYRQKMYKRVDSLDDPNVPVPEDDREEFMLFFSILPAEDRAGLLKELQLTDTERARIASTFDLPI